MITIETTSSGKNIGKLIEYYQSNFPLPKISKQIQQDIKDKIAFYNWDRPQQAIIRHIIDRNTHEITIGGKFSDITGYLLRGTVAHRVAPVKKKALHWGGIPGYFSKGHIVGAIKPTNFFQVFQSTREKLGLILKEFHQEAESKA